MSESPLQDAREQLTELEQEMRASVASVFTFAKVKPWAERLAVALRLLADVTPPKVSEECRQTSDKDDPSRVDTRTPSDGSPTAAGVSPFRALVERWRGQAKAVPKHSSDDYYDGQLSGQFKTLKACAAELWVVVEDAKGEEVELAEGQSMDMDTIPAEIALELMRCATNNGRISYDYLCALWQRGRDFGYNKGWEDGLDESAGDPRVESLEAGFKAIQSATNGEYSAEDQIVLGALQSAREFAIRLARREEHIRQLIEERQASDAVDPHAAVSGKPTTRDESSSPGVTPPQQTEAGLSSEFTQSFDAMVWAKAFVAHVQQYPGIPTDVDTMLSWFANALMRGYDEKSRQRDVDVRCASRCVLKRINASLRPSDDVPPSAPRPQEETDKSEKI